MTMQDLLRERHETEGPIRVGVIGAGQMGEGLICQMETMYGMRAYAVADIAPRRALDAYASANVPSAEILETDDAETASRQIRGGKRVVAVDAALMARIPEIEIVVEATGVPEIGVTAAMDAILARKHVLQMNVEADATVGYHLNRMARAAGVVYTLTAGDEPGATMELYDFAVSLGFTVVCIGKGKNNPLDRHATPATMADKAKQQMMNPKMLSSFVDGTKTMVEMTSLANAVGFVPDVRGMRGPEVTPDRLAATFVPRTDGGILDKPGVVEYGIGVAPGVFVIFTSDHPKIRRDLTYLRLGPGPYYSLYRPYHLANLETPISIARAVLKGETTIATEEPPTAETVAVAKRDLAVGERIDDLGGFGVYGLIEQADTAAAENLLPLGLAPNSILRKAVQRDSPLTYDDVEVNEDSTIVHIRRLQDRSIRAHPTT